jgi:hypothetical protein
MAKVSTPTGLWSKYQQCSEGTQGCRLPAPSEIPRFECSVRRERNTEV